MRAEGNPSFYKKKKKKRGLGVLRHVDKKFEAFELNWQTCLSWVCYKAFYTEEVKLNQVLKVSLPCCKDSERQRQSSSFQNLWGSIKLFCQFSLLLLPRKPNNCSGRDKVWYWRMEERGEEIKWEISFMSFLSRKKIVASPFPNM